MPAWGEASSWRKTRSKNIKIGVYCAAPALDLIVWNNNFSLINTGISLSYSSSTPKFGRAVILDNEFLLPRNTAATAVIVTGSSNGQYFDQVVVRNNYIAAELITGSTALLAGIQVFNASSAFIENNVIKDYGTAAEDAVSVQNCTVVKAFNNLNGTGQLLRAYDVTVGHTLQELEDFVEDSLIGI
jgi:hypothetical protein